LLKLESIEGVLENPNFIEDIVMAESIGSESEKFIRQFVVL